MPLPTTIVFLTAAVCLALLNVPGAVVICLVAALGNELVRMGLVRAPRDPDDEYQVRVPSVRQKTPFGPPPEDDD